jgi:hypothetical protein
MIEVGAGSGPDSSNADVRGSSATGKIRLGAEEERVFRKVDGVRTVQAIIDSTGSGEFEVCRTLFDFMNRNLIAPAGRDRAALDERAEGAVAAPAGPGYAVAALVSLLALAGIVVQCRSPFAVTGLAGVLPGTHDVLKDGVLRTRLVRLERAIEAWRATHGRPPTSLDDLVKAGLVERSYLYDPWSRRIRYEADAAGYRLSAVEEPGRPGASVDRRGVR